MFTDNPRRKLPINFIQVNRYVNLFLDWLLLFSDLFSDSNCIFRDGYEQKSSRGSTDNLQANSNWVNERK